MQVARFPGVRSGIITLLWALSLNGYGNGDSAKSGTKVVNAPPVADRCCLNETDEEQVPPAIFFAEVLPQNTELLPRIESRQISCLSEIVALFVDENLPWPALVALDIDRTMINDVYMGNGLAKIVEEPGASKAVDWLERHAGIYVVAITARSVPEDRFELTESHLGVGNINMLTPQNNQFLNDVEARAFLPEGQRYRNNIVYTCGKHKGEALEGLLKAFWAGRGRYFRTVVFVDDVDGYCRQVDESMTRHVKEGDSGAEHLPEKVLILKKNPHAGKVCQHSLARPMPETLGDLVKRIIPPAGVKNPVANSIKISTGL